MATWTQPGTGLSMKHRLPLQEAEWRRAAGEGGCIEPLIAVLKELGNETALEVEGGCLPGWL